MSQDITDNDVVPFRTLPASCYIRGPVYMVVFDGPAPPDYTPPSQAVLAAMYAESIGQDQECAGVGDKVTDKSGYVPAPLLANCPTCGKKAEDWLCQTASYRIYCDVCGTSKQRYRTPGGFLSTPETENQPIDGGE